VLLVGLLARAFRGFFPIAAVSSSAERLVGLMLVGIGIWGLRRALVCHLHAHAHEHPEDRQVPSSHVHIHLHLDGERMSHPHPHPHSHDTHRRAPHPHSHAAFFVGTLHGAAGTSHVLGVLPSLAFPTWGQTLGYLASYGVGTILAMVAFATALGWLGRGGKAQGTWPYRWLMGACSLAAVAVGGFWLAG
jgi:ABC-type nickel/cobalt efflux system permease component RcnA